MELNGALRETHDEIVTHLLLYASEMIIDRGLDPRTIGPLLQEAGARSTAITVMAAETLPQLPHLQRTVRSGN